MSLTKKEIFEKVKERFSDGRGQAVVGASCVYRAPDGNKCAVGCLIPDDLWYSRINNKSLTIIQTIGSSKSKKLIEYLGKDNLSLLRELQKLHDKKSNWDGGKFLAWKEFEAWRDQYAE